LTSLMVIGSSVVNDIEKKKSHVNPKKITGNMSKINIELELFFQI